MTDHDRKAARREIADALLKALERRHEIADVVVESENKAAAVEAIVTLLDTSHVAADAVMRMSFDQLTMDSRAQDPGRARRPEQAAELHPRRASGKLG